MKRRKTGVRLVSMLVMVMLVFSLVPGTVVSQSNDVVGVAREIPLSEEEVRDFIDSLPKTFIIKDNILKPANMGSMFYAFMPSGTSGISQAVLERGNFRLWSRTTVYWGHTGDMVLWAEAHQESGAIFPNAIAQLGTTVTRWSDFVKNIRANYRFGIGFITPWGDLTIHNRTKVDSLRVFGDGSAVDTSR